MIQALIVENPKWERFSSVSDKFKALKGEAVLVVRGRNKEKRDAKVAGKLLKSPPSSPESLAVDLRKQGKTDEEIKKAVEAFSKKVVKVAVALAMFVCVNAFAQAPLTGYLPATSLTAQSTNSNEGGAFWALKIDQEAAYQLTVTATNAHSAVTHGNIFVYLDTAIQGNVWVTNAYVMSFSSPTNISTTTSIARLTNTTGGLLLRVGKIANPNTNFMSVSDFYIAPKD